MTESTSTEVTTASMLLKVEEGNPAVGISYMNIVRAVQTMKLRMADAPIDSPWTVVLESTGWIQEWHLEKDAGLVYPAPIMVGQVDTPHKAKVGARIRMRKHGDTKLCELAPGTRVSYELKYRVKPIPDDPRCGFDGVVVGSGVFTYFRHKPSGQDSPSSPAKPKEAVSAE